MFAGYSQYRASFVAGALRKGGSLGFRCGVRAVVARRSPLLPTLGHLVLGGRPVPPALRRKRMPATWLGPELQSIEALTSPVEDVGGTVLARTLWRQIRWENLPALLRYEDRNSMAFGIEARVPFLDHRLVEAALQLPDRLKIGSDGVQKLALRRAMDGIVPAEILGRRDKIAFEAPAQWFGRSDPFPSSRPGLLISKSSGLVSRDLRHEVIRDPANTRFAWRLWLTELWLRAGWG